MHGVNARRAQKKHFSKSSTEFIPILENGICHVGIRKPYIVTKKLIFIKKY